MVVYNNINNRSPSSSSSQPEENKGTFYYHQPPNDFDLDLEVTSYESSREPNSGAGMNIINDGYYDNNDIYYHQQPGQQQQQQQQNDPKRNNRLIWVIDDEEMIVCAVGEYLHSSGYQVQTFTNASLPLYLLNHHDDYEFDEVQKMEMEQLDFDTMHNLPDAIVCDILMPNINGLQFLSILRSKPTTRKLPFIFLTAKGTTEDRIMGYDYGADGYLMKPFDPEELVVLLDRMVDRREFLDNGANRNMNNPSNDTLSGVSDGVSVDELKNDLDEIKSLLRKLNDDGSSYEKTKGLMKLPPASSSSEITRREVAPPQNDSNLYLECDDDILEEEQEEEILMTKKEIDVLTLLCEGYMNKEIAEELKYSTRWVEGILTKLYRKTNCANRTELVKWAVSLGYIDV